MSNPVHSTRARRAGIVLVLGLATVAAPAAAQASAVDLATAAPFVVLGGSTVTNTGPSVLNGELGLAPGTSLTGFGLPAVVNGATHNNDAVAGQAQSDLTTAYLVAAGQPVAPADELTGQNLGNRTLTAGAYRYASSAQLTGVLTLDAQGDPNAQFVFEIGSTLTTASASSVVLVNGASPCNVYWQVGSSATLDTTTSFQGNVMALTSISLNDGASVLGRLLARNGQISLINNVLDRPLCATGTTTTPGTTSTAGTSPAALLQSLISNATPAQLAQAAQAAEAARVAVREALIAATPTSTAPAGGGTAILRRTPGQACTDGFSATVRGRLIARVVFSMDGKRLSSRTRSPFRVFVRASSGRHNVRARVTFKDATPARTLTVAYRACARIALNPRRGPSKFTG